MKKQFILLVSVLGLWFAVPSYAGRGCTGSTPCSACSNCTGCKHCAKNGGTCGTCSKTTYAKAGEPIKDTTKKETKKTKRKKP